MKLTANNTKFEQCPEFTGRAVCVDVTPLRKRQSQYGEQEVFKLVFEVELEKEDGGGRYCVWSRNFTPTLNEKSNFRKFLRGWFGRDLTEAELQAFETDSLIGKAAQVVVVHEFRENETYANIAACTPLRGEALKPTGKYIRVQDRKPEDGGKGAGASGGYRRAEPVAGNAEDLGATKIHVGKCKGLELRDLSPAQAQALIEHWLPTAKANVKPTADDKRLIAALEWLQAQEQQEEDNVPY